MRFGGSNLRLFELSRNEDDNTTHHLGKMRGLFIQHCFGWIKIKGTAPSVSSRPWIFMPLILAFLRSTFYTPEISLCSISRYILSIDLPLWTRAPCWEFGNLLKKSWILRNKFGPRNYLWISEVFPFPQFCLPHTNTNYIQW